MNKTLIYGVTGYIGDLISRMAQEQGIPHLVGGRNHEKMVLYGRKHNLETTVFSLDDEESLKKGLEDIDIVLNCAGPFAKTSKKFAQACIDKKTHYLDIAGEIPEFEGLASLDNMAKSQNVMILPGVGFGIVPTDCVAVYLQKQLPPASRLTLVFEAIGGVSQGTLQTLLNDIHKDGFIRSEGELVAAKPASKTMDVTLGKKTKSAALNPWRGDISTAYYSTKIKNIETFTVFPGLICWLMKSRGILAKSMIKFLKSITRILPTGPNQKQLKIGHTTIWGEVENSDGDKVKTILRGPEAYLFTALSALMILQKVQKEELQPGFQTPAMVYGCDFITEIDGVIREIL